MQRQDMQYKAAPREAISLRRSLFHVKESFAHGLAEIVAGLPVMALAADGTDNVAAQEEEHVGQAEQDGHARGRAADDELPGVERGIEHGKVLHLDRQDHEEQHLDVGIHRRVGEEEREVEVGVARVARDHAGDDGGDHADEVVEVELDLAPAGLKPRANRIIEVEREEDEERRAVRRREDKGHDSPDLPAQQRTAGERDGRIEPVAHRRPDEHQQIDGGLPEDDVLHQIADGKAPEFALEIVVDGVSIHRG